MQAEVSRRDWLRGILSAAAVLAVPGCAGAAEEEAAAAAALDTLGATGEAAAERSDAPPSPEDLRRFNAWAADVRAARPGSLGLAAARVGELASGTPYEAFTLEQYLRAGGSPARTEPLTLHLDRFDCVSLVESCLAVARVARSDAEPSWDAFAREMERMRYRGGERQGYVSRLHYFSEWIDDGERRGLVRSLGEELGGVEDARPLRFMSEHPDSYPADPEVRAAIAAMEQALDGRSRWVIPTARIAQVQDRIQTGDVLAFATGIDGLDVTHSAFAYRDGGDVLRVLHAPLSGGAVEVTGSTLPEYVAAIRRSTGVLVARPV